jgi:hypothetical protein
MNEEQLNSKIREVLFKRGESIQPGADRFDLIKVRLSERESSTQVMKRYRDKIYFNMKRPVISVCCVAVILTLLCVFNPTVKVWAQEGVQKMSVVAYVIIKGEDGVCQTARVKVEDKAEGSGLVMMLEDMDLGFKYKAPDTIAKDYIAGETVFSNSSGSSISLFYRSGDSVLVLKMTNEDWMMDYAEKGGDNRKELDVKGVTVYYYEDPFPVYPLVKGSDGLWKNDVSKPPTKIKTAHMLVWEHEGIGYQLGDQGENISYEIMKQAVDEIINFQSK